MRPVRLAKSVALLLAIPAAIGAACTFPIIDFGGPDAGATTSSSSSGGGAPTAASSTGSAGGNPTEASSSSSSGGALPCNVACDCDGDQEMAWDCGGTDCADYDPRANIKADFLPDSTPIFGPKKKGTLDFDFNCNMQEESEFDVVGCHSVAGFGCTGKGFAKTTACGQKEALIGCGMVDLNPCTQLPNPPKQSQRCR